MKTGFIIKIARKLPFLRGMLMKQVYRRRGKKLEALVPYFNDKFYLYRINGLYIPNEELHEKVSFPELLEKAKNESLYHYIPGQGDVIVDIGAGLGEETLLFSRLAGDQGRVVAIEAHPSAYKVLTEVVLLNNLANVRTHHLAIGPLNGRVTLTDPMGSYESAFIKNEGGHGFHIHSVPLGIFLDSQQIMNIDLLKANIEGAERYLVETLNEEQMKRIRHVAIACHDFRSRKEKNDFFKTRDLIKKFLVNSGFEVFERQTGIDYLDDWIYGTNKF